VTPKNVICIAIDRLHAGLVGAYGNSWIRTAALDRLAADSFLFDQAFVDGTDLAGLYRSFWQGIHAAARHDEAATSLPRLAAAAGLHTALVTDEPLVAALHAAGDFAERSFVESPSEGRTAANVAETALARLFGAVSQWINSAPQPFFLWVHSRGMAGPWDAPLALRNRFAEEDDPQPPTFVTAPDYWLPDEFDADEVLGVKHAYAGQVAALDQCLAALAAQFNESPLAERTQLTLLSARGFPLGEHRRIGPCDEALYNETTQLVWLMRFPDGRGRLARAQAIVQPHDLPGTLADWLELDRAALGSGRATSLLDIVDGQVESLRDHVLLVSQHDRAIRTPGWLLRQPLAGAPELYAKPGDRWEVNEVASLLPEIVAGLEAALARFDETGGADQLPPLAEPLVSAVD
jgi:hypothetical protein